MENRIRELRKLYSLSAFELAKKMNLSENSVTAYERGERDPSTDTLCKLAEFFNCSIDYILFRTDIKKHHEYNRIISEPDEINKKIVFEIVENELTTEQLKTSINIIVLEAMENGLTIEQLKSIINIWLNANRQGLTIEQLRGIINIWFDSNGN